jgi:hypothetical protein
MSMGLMTKATVNGYRYQPFSSRAKKNGMGRESIFGQDLHGDVKKIAIVTETQEERVMSLLGGGIVAASAAPYANMDDAGSVYGCQFIPPPKWQFLS